MKIEKDDSAMPFFKWNEAGYGDCITIYGSDGGKQFIPYTQGLTKREYFASMAILKLAEGNTPHTAAKLAVEYADALIEELNKE
jgi:hypothetical protein